MKKQLLAILAALVAVFGLGSAALAYPPPGSEITVSNPNPAPGETITVTVDCGDDDGSIVVVLGSETESDDCDDGEASVQIQAPSTPGQHTGTVTNSAGATIGTFVVTVVAPTPTTPPGGLPATGSDSTSTMTYIAIGLLVAGLGMFAVATVRRRQPTNA